jgi:hypothetical protein
MATHDPRILVASGGDVAQLSFSGALPDIAEQMERHAADSVMINTGVADLAFLRPVASRLRTLSVNCVCHDVSGLADLTELKVLALATAPTFAPLAALPNLKRLDVAGSAPWHELAALPALRELVINGSFAEGAESPLEDLMPLVPIEQLEYLRLRGVVLQSLNGIERMRALRSLALHMSYVREPRQADYVRERFGFDVTRIVPRRASETRRLRSAQWFLHADAVVAEQVRAAIPADRMYAAQVTHDRPACVLLLIDRSGSMRGASGEDARARAKAKADGLSDADLDALERSLGSEMLRSEAVAHAVNRFLPDLAARCGNSARVDIGIVEYGERVGSAWGGGLAGRALVPLNEVIANPLRSGSDGPVWIESQASGRTPLQGALRVATEMIRAWCNDHPDSFPPVVINLYGEDPDLGDIYRDAWALRAQATQHGPALLFWIAKRYGYSGGAFSAAELLTADEHHFRLASGMPPTVADAARRAGFQFPGTVRGCFSHPAPDEYATLLHVFTAIPGIPWSETYVRHRLPPVVLDTKEIERLTVRRRPDGSVSDFEVPRIKGPMTLDVFWKVIDKTRKDVEDVDQHGDRILETLEQFSERDLIAFDRLLSERLAESHRYDLWAVAFIALGGCSDDAFDYFQCWLVSQGRAYFEAALADPVKAARRINPGDEAQFERLRYIAAEVFEAKTGRADFGGKREIVDRSLTGASWREEDLAKRYQRIARRFGTERPGR